jgi:ZIP family zinc transporter
MGLTAAVVLAAALGALAASALLVGAVLAYVARPKPRVVAVVMALGSGLLIGSVAYDLVEDARITLPVPAIAGWLLVGATVFVLGSRLISRLGRRGGSGGSGGSGDTDTDDADDSALPIVLGSALDGVPESMVLGMSLVHGGVSIPLLFGIALSNLPEGIAGSTGLRSTGWSARRTLGLWAIVVAVSAVAAGLGNQLVASDDRTVMGIAQTFAAGALLAMITDTMIPESYAIERWWTGLLVVAGFCGSLLLASALG